MMFNYTGIARRSKVIITVSLILICLSAWHFAIDILFQILWYKLFEVPYVARLTLSERLKMPPLPTNLSEIEDWVGLGQNTNITACTDFYGYSCGNYPYAQSGEEMAQDLLINDLLQQLQNETYMRNAIPPVRHMVDFVEKCVETVLQKPDKARNELFKYMGTVVRTLVKKSGVQFAILVQNVTMVYSQLPSPDKLGLLLGMSHALYGAGPFFVPSYVLKQEQIMINLPFLKSGNLDRIFGMVQSIGYTLGMDLDIIKLDKDALKLAKFMRSFSLDVNDETKGNSLEQLQKRLPMINWSIYFNQVFYSNETAHEIGKKDKPIIMTFSDFRKTTEILKAANNSSKITADTIINFIFVATLDNIQRTVKSVSRDRGFLGTDHVKKDLKLATNKCLIEAMHSFPYVASRVLVDKMLPTGNDRAELQKEAEEIMVKLKPGLSKYQKAFESALLPSSHLLVTNLEPAIMYPKWIMDDQNLLEYRKVTNFSDYDSVYAIMVKNNRIRMFHNKQDFFENSPSRKLFNFPLENWTPMENNVQFSFLTREIYFPLHYFRPPIYHKKWSKLWKLATLGTLFSSSLLNAVYYTERSKLQYFEKSKCYEYVLGNQIKHGHNNSQGILDMRQNSKYTNNDWGLFFAFMTAEPLFSHSEKKTKQKQFFSNFAKLYCASKDDSKRMKSTRFRAEVNQQITMLTNVYGTPGFAIAYNCTFIREIPECRDENHIEETHEEINKGIVLVDKS